MDIWYPGHNPTVVAAPHCWCGCVTYFLPSIRSHMAVLLFCLFSYFLSKYFASSGRLCQAKVCSLEDRIPLICGIRLLPWQRLLTKSNMSLLGRSGNSDLVSSSPPPTTAQRGLSVIINYVPGTRTLFCLPFKIQNYLAPFLLFQLGSTLLPVMTNPLVGAGIS